MNKHLLSKVALALLLCSTTTLFSAERNDESTLESTRPVSARERALRLGQLGVDRWQRSGVRGRGVKVAILDSGFRGYRSHLGKALPKQVTARSFRFDGDLEARDSQHGILCGEVVHALAPDAELLFANWEPDNPKQFLDAVRWARQQGARVISCSIIMPSWSDGEGGGAIHEELARILGPGTDKGDVLFFASAGNIAERHWSGSFHEDAQHFHAWKQGVCDNTLRPWGTERVTVELYGQLGSDYEVTVLDRTAEREVGKAIARGLDKCCTGSVRFQPESDHTYQVRVRLAKGAPGKFHLVALGSALSCSTAPGSIPFPADGPSVIAVGAVDNAGQRLVYSSCGPNSVQPKPDLVAPVPFASLWRSKPFGGTSAAAPQAAALATLWLSRNPSWTSYQVRTALRTSSKDLNQPGHDWETGYGAVQLPSF